MRSLSLAIAMLWAPVATVAQPVNEGKLVTHNGSLMVIINPRPGGMMIQYQDPAARSVRSRRARNLAGRGSFARQHALRHRFVFSRWCGPSRTRWAVMSTPPTR